MYVTPAAQTSCEPIGASGAPLSGSLGEPPDSMIPRSRALRSSSRTRSSHEAATGRTTPLSSTAGPFRVRKSFISLRGSLILHTLWDKWRGDDHPSPAPASSARITPKSTVITNLNVGALYVVTRNNAPKLTNCQLHPMPSDVACGAGYPTSPEPATSALF